MDRKVLLWIIIGILFISVLYLTFQAGSPSTGVVQSATKIATSSASASSSYGGMVGGC